jgi:hypothetical protein
VAGNRARQRRPLDHATWRDASSRIILNATVIRACT